MVFGIEEGDRMNDERYDVILGVNGDDYVFANDVPLEKAKILQRKLTEKCIKAKTGAYCKVVLSDEVIE